MGSPGPAACAARLHPRGHWPRSRETSTGCRDLPGLHLLDFLASALAIAGPLDRPRSDGVGVAVERAIEATRQVVATNTNLGMVLLLAPLAAVPMGSDLAYGRRGRPRSHDRRGCPGRLPGDPAGPARRHGVGPGAGHRGGADAAAPRVMALAADRDLVARQYANGFRDVFDEALPALRRCSTPGGSIETAIVATLLDDAVAASRFADRPQGRDGTGPGRLAAGGGSPRGGLAGSRPEAGRDVRGIRRLAPRSEPPV